MKGGPALVGIDTGGTFTDFVAFVDGTLRTHKVLSTAHNPAVAVLRGLQDLLPDAGPCVVTYGSTVATNTLLERTGARVVLLTTAGFEDLLEIGRQNRPLLYDLEPVKPAPVVPRRQRVGLRERDAADGPDSGGVGEAEEEGEDDEEADGDEDVVFHGSPLRPASGRRGGGRSP